MSKYHNPASFESPAQHPPATFQPRRGAKNGELIMTEATILFQTNYENDTVMIMRPFVFSLYW